MLVVVLFLFVVASTAINAPVIASTLTSEIVTIMPVLDFRRYGGGAMCHDGCIGGC
jgi:hypothetical protein